ncbi:MAG TPA: threonine dehydratase [Anaeromyxobacteraceae bacterium]|nr:threonine dehydratase [Anaeromyxobacteraceae bacterium]
MSLFSRAELEEAAAKIHEVLPPTPEYLWPLLSRRLGTETWVKHENHLPVGAFKVRGGVLALRELSERGVTHVVAATRGNHGQSVAYAAQRYGMKATIVVPHGNSATKNEAMQALGAELVVHGHDFQAALEHAHVLAQSEGAHYFPSFSMTLVRGVASYALELFAGAGKLDVVYVPVGLGSGLCGVLAARDALSLKTEVVGVVAARAQAYALSFKAGRPVSTPTADTAADGLACRVPNEEALSIILRGAARMVTVEEDEIRAAMRHLFTDTHNLAEGAGAAALAAALQERELLRGRRVGLVLSGGNVDPELFLLALGEGEVPARRP